MTLGQKFRQTAVSQKTRGVKSCACALSSNFHFCSSVWNMAGKCPFFKSENEFRPRLWSLRIEFQDWKNRICSGINRFKTYWKINRTRSCFIKVRKILVRKPKLFFSFFFLVKSVQGDKRELSRRWNTGEKKLWRF